MRIVNVISVALLGVSALAACSTARMSERSCETADWGVIGFKDGVEGQRIARFEKRLEQCRAFGIEPGAQAYFAGRNDGLTALCNRKSGYEFATVGKVYEGVCSADLEPEFLMGYVSGRRIYALAREVESVRSDVSSTQSSIDYQYAEVKKYRERLNTDDLTDEDRNKVRQSLKLAQDQIYYLEDKQNQLIYELGRVEERYAQAIATIEDYELTPEYQHRLAQYREIHQFARASEAVDFCAEKSRRSFECRMRAGQSIRDSQTDEICAGGEGVVRPFARNERTGVDGELYRYQSFDFFPLNSRGARPARKPVSAFEVFFSADETVDVIGYACLGGRPL